MSLVMLRKMIEGGIDIDLCTRLGYIYISLLPVSDENKFLVQLERLLSLMILFYRCVLRLDLQDNEALMYVSK